MLREPPRAGRPAPAPLQVPAVKKPDLPSTTAKSATTPARQGRGEFGSVTSVEPKASSRVPLAERHCGDGPLGILASPSGPAAIPSGGRQAKPGPPSILVRARARRPHRRPPVPVPPRVDQRPCGGVAHARRVLGLLPRAVAPDAAVPEGLARALPRPHRRRRPRGRLSAFARPRGGAGRGRAAGRALPGRDRLRARRVGAVREPRMAGAVSVRPARDAAALPLRRGRLRRDRARDPGGARVRTGPARPVPARGDARRAARGRKPTMSRARTAARTRPAACGRCSTGTAR